MLQLSLVTFTLILTVALVVEGGDQLFQMLNPQLWHDWHAWHDPIEFWFRVVYFGAGALFIIYTIVDNILEEKRDKLDKLKSVKEAIKNQVDDSLKAPCSCGSGRRFENCHGR